MPVLEICFSTPSSHARASRLTRWATALKLDLMSGRVRAEGDLDFRGTLGVDRSASVGFRAIRLSFEVEGNLTEEEQATLLKLTERYCVVFQTLKSPAEFDVTMTVS